jgi:hypothetical protein
MDASIELLGISSPGLGTQSMDAPSSTVLKVHCRITVAGARDCEKPFDTVTLRLQGMPYVDVAGSITDMVSRRGHQI